MEDASVIDGHDTSDQMTSMTDYTDDGRSPEERLLELGIRLPAPSRAGSFARRENIITVTLTVSPVSSNRRGSGGPAGLGGLGQLRVGNGSSGFGNSGGR